MRAGSLFGGIVLLLIGGYILDGGANDYSEGQSLGGQLVQDLGGTNYTAIGSTLLVIGGIIALVGLVLLIRGFGTSRVQMAAAAPTYSQPHMAQPAAVPMQQAVPSTQAIAGESKFCIACGKGMPKNGAFCPSCGASQV